jgi:hypothetical protein
MKRIKIVGLCLMAVLAGSALVAATAQAASPEYGQCVSGQKKANYTESLCKTLSVKIVKGKEELAHKGTFEWEKAPLATCVAVKKGFYSNSECTSRDESKGKPKGKFEKDCTTSCADFTTKSGAAAIYNFTPENEAEPEKLPQGATLAGAGGTVKCAASTGTGEFTGGESTTETLSLTGCESAGKACTTSGQAAGTIQARVIGNLELLPAGKGVGSYLEPAEEIKYACGTVSEDIEYNRAIGNVTGDISTPSNSSTDTWEVTSPSEGVQKDRYFLAEEVNLEGGPFEHWEGVITGYEDKHFGEFTAVGIALNQEVTSEAAVEVRP